MRLAEILNETEDDGSVDEQYDNDIVTALSLRLARVLVEGVDRSI